jgi:hypothetical protein
LIRNILGYSGKGGVNGGVLLGFQLPLQRPGHEFIATARVPYLDRLIYSSQ